MAVAAAEVMAGAVSVVAVLVAVLISSHTSSSNSRRSPKRKISSICPSLWTRRSRSSLVGGERVCFSIVIFRVCVSVVV